MPRRPAISCWAHGVEESVLLRLGASNAAGAVLSFASSELLASPRADASVPADRGYLVAFAAYMAFAMPVGYWNGRRVFRRACRWLAEDREPTAQERRAALLVPWGQAGWAFSYWLDAALLFGILNARWEGSAAPAVRTVLSIALGGLTTCAIAYLLVERAMRPVFALVLERGGCQRTARHGLRLRILDAWALGTAIPLLIVGVAFIGRGESDYARLGEAIWFLVLGDIVSSGLLMWWAARAIVDPIDAVRDALTRVQADDLDVEVPVDDGGEIGLLQSGFNRMVDGLRERRTLQDLFGRYVGPGVARQALETGVALGGERREVSVLFVDILASTGLAESRPPDEVVAILNVFFDAVVRRVGAEGGWVNKFEGDGAMCVFGAPDAQPDHADNALRAARTLRRDLLALAAAYPGLDAAVGVSSGVVVAGNVGTEQRYEYTVIGDPVNEAARLTEAAKRRLGRVLASDESVERATEEAARWRVVDELALRGRRRRTLAYDTGPQA